jgi:diguanylate cyclase (GGDEF)-like protein
MAVISETAAERAHADGRAAAGDGLPGQARVYLLAVAAAATAAAAGSTGAPLSRESVVAFLLLTACASIAQLFVVRTPANQLFHTAVAFVVAAALVLPPELVALMVVVQHVPDWVKERYPWYVQGFNIVNYILDALAASQAARLVLEVDAIEPAARFALAGVVASVVFVVLNHAALAGMLLLARRISVRESRLFAAKTISTDLVLAAVGVVLATLWKTNPWVIAAVLAPLVLIHRSLSVLALLREEVRIDAKTRLFNARHFGAVLAEELARAARSGRPLSVIMADLDLLRAINNAHGHLAGDAVLEGVASIFRRHLRPYDLPARFGGEEFAIILPETSGDEAFEIAERIRVAVAEERFHVATAEEPVRASLSLGVASFPEASRDPNELVHLADLAAYQAKLEGRNRVSRASLERTARSLAV